ncbi:MAG: WbqC family protein [Candidatus Limimorpha sp.]
MSDIFPTAYLPDIRYISLFLRAESPEIELYETYQKQSCRTRCNVMTANGLQTLAVPIVKVMGNHTMTKDIIISYKEPWQQIHRRCLESAYRKTPFFDHYFPYLEKAYSTRFDTLIELNEFCLKFILKTMKSSRPIQYTDDYHSITGSTDYRISLSKWRLTDTVFPKYYQVFSDRQPFVSNLSIIDLLFNEGPEAMNYIANI